MFTFIKQNKYCANIKQNLAIEKNRKYIKKKHQNIEKKIDCAMTKVKRNPRREATTTVTTKAKSNTTTPSKTINGGVRKVRVNIKNQKLQRKSSEESLVVTRSIETIDTIVSPKVRLCFVKLKRTHINSTGSSSSSKDKNNNNSNTSNTLQAQCKADDNNDVVAKQSKQTEENEKGGGRRDNIEKSNVYETIPTQLSMKNIENLNKFEEIKKAPTRNNTCNINTTKSSAIVTTPPHSVDIDENAAPQIGESQNIKISRRRCVINIKRTSVVEFEKKNIQKSQILEPSTPSNTRRCLVRLQRTPMGQRNTRNCLVRLQRTPSIANRTRKEALTKSPVEVIELLSDESPTAAPVIDEIKRNNFQKLSLNYTKNRSLNKTVSESIAPLSKSTNDNIGTTSENNVEKESTNLAEKELENINLRKFKHFHKLSLKRSTTVRNKNTTSNLETTQFEPLKNSTIFFEPQRNSTLLAFGFTKDNNKTMVTNEKSPPKNKSSSQNLANKSQEIEDLLNSLDDDNDDDVGAVVVVDNNENTVENHTQISHKPNKFFHRKEKNSPENIVKEIEVVETQKSPPKVNGVAKKKGRIYSKRSSIPKRDNVYEFLSQSQTSDSDNTKRIDPTADIIKRLIAQGKVRVATTLKGKGKPVIKRRQPNTQQGKKLKQTTAKKVRPRRNKPIENKKKKDPENKIVEDNIDLDDHFADHFDNDGPSHEVESNTENQIQDQPVRPSTNNHDQEGTFSRLARSVLINQAGRSDMQRKKAQRLLEIAKTFVSTPKNNKRSITPLPLHSDLSPIPMPPPRPATKASPWRVDEDNFPSVFNFNRSSSNLPSFSSDFIPATPRKEKPQNKTPIRNQPPQSPIPVMDNEHSLPSLPPQSPLHNTMANEPTPIVSTNEQHVLSSFSSNDSNGENMPPPSKVTQENANDNDNIFNLKQLPNPRRALNYRSPLKAINILEVVYLPPLKPFPAIGKSAQSKELEGNNVEMFGFEEDLQDDSLIHDNSVVATTPQKTLSKKSKNRPTEDLFGFEEFLTQTEISSQECDDLETDDHRNKTMHDHLQDLRKLRPDDECLPLRLHKEKPMYPLKSTHLFDGNNSEAVDDNGMRQRGIKEMLCSTMIEQHPKPSTSKEALRQLKKRNLNGANNKPNFDGEDSNLSELFKDPDPETTFDENVAHRTYIRPYKRKRRLKQKQYVMFLDSDESGDEYNSAENHKHQNSHETDTSSEMAPKKKRKRKEPKANPELTEFIHDFNEMCKDVDSYELIVEKSA